MLYFGHFSAGFFTLTITVFFLLSAAAATGSLESISMISFLDVDFGKSSFLVTILRRFFSFLHGFSSFFFSPSSLIILFPLLQLPSQLALPFSRSHLLEVALLNLLILFPLIFFQISPFSLLLRIFGFLFDACTFFVLFGIFGFFALLRSCSENSNSHIGAAHFSDPRSPIVNPNIFRVFQSVLSLLKMSGPTPTLGSSRHLRSSGAPSDQPSASAPALSQVSAADFSRSRASSRAGDADSDPRLSLGSDFLRGAGGGGSLPPSSGGGGFSPAGSSHSSGSVSQIRPLSISSPTLSVPRSNFSPAISEAAQQYSRAQQAQRDAQQQARDAVQVLAVPDLGEHNAILQALLQVPEIHQHYAALQQQDCLITLKSLYDHKLWMAG